MMLVFVLQESEHPLVVVAIFIQEPTPFVTVFFERLLKLQYPKNRIKLYIDNRVNGTFVSSVFPPKSGCSVFSQLFLPCLLQETYHESHVSSFLQDHGSLYQEVKSVGPEENVDGAESRNLGL